MNYEVNKDEELFNFLNTKYDRKKVKVLLTNECVLVNDKIVTKYNYLLKKSDIVTVNKYKNELLDIIYEDKDIIVVNKKHDLLTISNQTDEVNLYSLVSEYVKRNNRKNKIFIVHRLDKETSGIVIFAKNEKIKNLLQNDWNNLAIKREYIAVVEGETKEEDTLINYLKENENHYVYVSKTGKKCITNYKKIKSNGKYSLLSILIKTGRKNQIRVQLKEINHPIVGDSKYGKKDKRLYLHAYKLEIINPINNKRMTFKTNIPDSFNLFF